MKSGIDKLLTPEETAEILGVTQSTLMVWRCTGKYNLPFVKIGRKVMYEPNAIKAFIKKRTVKTED